MFLHQHQHCILNISKTSLDRQLKYTSAKCKEKGRRKRKAEREKMREKERKKTTRTQFLTKWKQCKRVLCVEWTRSSVMFAAIRFGIKAFGISFTASVYFDWFCADQILSFRFVQSRFIYCIYTYSAVVMFLGLFIICFYRREAMLVNRFAALTRLRINIDIEKSDDL